MVVSILVYVIILLPIVLVCGITDWYMYCITVCLLVIINLYCTLTDYRITMSHLGNNRTKHYRIISRILFYSDNGSFSSIIYIFFKYASCVLTAHHAEFLQCLLTFHITMRQSQLSIIVYISIVIDR